MLEGEKRKQIDTLLEENARNVANFGTGSRYDLKTKEAFKSSWEAIKTKIKAIDEQFWNIIK